MKILVDWGSSNFRAFLHDGNAVIDHCAAADGILKLFSANNQYREKQFFSHYLQDKLGEWLAEHPHAPVIMCGAVGSREGWIDAGYVATPSSLSDIGTALRQLPPELTVELGGRDMFIVPGVAHEKNGRFDTMRSEETKALGAMRHLGMTDGLLCVPGTHCKWVKVAGGRIVDFHTVLTGEMFGILSGHGSLATLFRDEKNAVDVHDASFHEGIDLAQQDFGLLSNIWQVRARKLRDVDAPQNLTAFLSGILIGHELRHAAQYYPGAQDVILLADQDQRRDFYEQALKMRGWNITAEIDSEIAVCTGLLGLLEGV